MLKKLVQLLALTLCVGLVGLGSTCQKTPQKVAVDTLASTGKTVQAAYDSYLTLVVQGQLPTNDVPRISVLYGQFQSAFGAAAAAAQWSTNATFSNPDVVNAAAAVVNAINEIRTGGKR